eukprot:9129035-Heterocapsa_arctica.AAC.1
MSSSVWTLRVWVRKEHTQQSSAGQPGPPHSHHNVRRRPVPPASALEVGSNSVTEEPSAES